MKKILLFCTCATFIFMSCTKEAPIDESYLNPFNDDTQSSSALKTEEIFIYQPGPSSLKDAHIIHQIENDNMNNNFGEFPFNGAWCSDYSINYSRGLIEFDISSIPDVNVSSVTLLIHGHPRGELSNYPNLGDVSAYQVTSSWEEMEVTWNTMPTFSESPIDTESPNTTQWYEWNITGLYEDWKSGVTLNHGIMLINQLEGSGRTGIALKSNDYSDTTLLPQLVINFTQPELSATLDIKPNKIVLKSNAKWIKAFIELPEGYFVEDILPESIFLWKVDGLILSPPMYAEDQIIIGDYDNDGISDISLRFDQKELKKYLEDIGVVNLTFYGELNDGTSFGCSDTIEVK